MAEETESVRVDRSKREIEGRERMSWGGKKVILPHGSVLPSSGESGEVFIKDGDPPVMYSWNDTTNWWSTVGPG